LGSVASQPTITEVGAAALSAAGASARKRWPWISLRPVA